MIQCALFVVHFTFLLLLISLNNNKKVFTYFVNEKNALVDFSTEPILKYSILIQSIYLSIYLYIYIYIYIYIQLLEIRKQKGQLFCVHTKIT